MATKTQEKQQQQQQGKNYQQQPQALARTVPMSSYAGEGEDVSIRQPHAEYDGNHGEDDEKKVQLLLSRMRQEIDDLHKEVEEESKRSRALFEKKTSRSSAESSR